MPFKGISYLLLWGPFCSTEQNHLCNFGSWYQEEQFCEIILNLDQWFRRCLLKVVLIWSSGSPSLQRSWTICAILERGHHGEHSFEVILYLDQCFRRRCCLKKKFMDAGGRTPHKDSSGQIKLGKAPSRGVVHKNTQHDKG